MFRRSFKPSIEQISCRFGPSPHGLGRAFGLNTAPPVLSAPDISPPDRDTAPPAPLAPLPAPMLTPPAAPPAAAPVDSVSEPDEPADDAPLVSDTSPLLPDALPSAEPTHTEPPPPAPAPAPAPAPLLLTPAPPAPAPAPQGYVGTAAVAAAPCVACGLRTRHAGGASLSLSQFKPRRSVSESVTVARESSRDRRCAVRPECPSQPPQTTPTSASRDHPRPGREI